MKSSDLLDIVLSPVDCSRGAPMGRSNRGEKPEGKRIFCRKIRLYDGDYDKGGAYWGYVKEYERAVWQAVNFIMFPDDAASEEWNGEFSESVYDLDFSDTLYFVKDNEEAVV
jgi:hypothetical protein